MNPAIPRSHYNTNTLLNAMSPHDASLPTIHETEASADVPASARDVDAVTTPGTSGSLPLELWLQIVEDHVIEAPTRDDQHRGLADLSAITRTCRSFHSHFVKRLFEEGVKRHPGLLCWAAEVGNTAAMRRLLDDGGADPNMQFWCRETDGRTEIHCTSHRDSKSGSLFRQLQVDTGRAVYAGQSLGRMMLLKQRERIFSKPLSGQAVFARYYQQQLVAFVCQHPGHYHKDRKECESYDKCVASNPNWADLIRPPRLRRLRVQSYLSPDALYWPIHLAVAQGHLEAVRMLADHGADVDAPVDESFCACSSRHHSISVLFREAAPYLWPGKHADESAESFILGRTSLHLAFCTHGLGSTDKRDAARRRAMVLELLGRGATMLPRHQLQPNIIESAISYAIMADDKELVAEMLSRYPEFGALLHLHDYLGRTPIWYALPFVDGSQIGAAAQPKSYAMAKYLVEEHGVDVDAGLEREHKSQLGPGQQKKLGGYTPLMHACLLGGPENLELARWLISHGADVNKQCKAQTVFPKEIPYCPYYPSPPWTLYHGAQPPPHTRWYEDGFGYSHWFQRARLALLAGADSDGHPVITKQIGTLRPLDLRIIGRRGDDSSGTLDDPTVQEANNLRLQDLLRRPGMKRCETTNNPDSAAGALLGYSVHEEVNSFRRTYLSRTWPRIYHTSPDYNERELQFMFKRHEEEPKVPQPEIENVDDLYVGLLLDAGAKLLPETENWMRNAAADTVHPTLYQTEEDERDAVKLDIHRHYRDCAKLFDAIVSHPSGFVPEIVAVRRRLEEEEAGLCFRMKAVLAAMMVTPVVVAIILMVLGIDVEIGGYVVINGVEVGKLRLCAVWCNRW